MPTEKLPLLLFVCLALFSAPAIAGGVEIIGHRGASYDAPENTVASVLLAWEQGADAAEIDIWLTSDGRIVACHDKSTKRTTGTDWLIPEHTLAELQSLDAGSWKAKKHAGEPIPTLENVLNTIPAGKRLFIEIKCGPEILPQLEKTLQSSGKRPKQTVLIAFDYDVIVQAKKRLPKVRAFWLYGTTPHVDKQTGTVSDRPEELLEKCKAAGADGLDLKYDSRLTPDFVERLHSAGLELYVWTVNDPVEARRLANLGVDGITTDRPAWLREQLSTAAE